MKRQSEAGKPFFVRINTTHMHLGTHTGPGSLGQAGRWQSPCHDTMIDHDRNVATVLEALDGLGIANGTFVLYRTDNGPHMNTWPDGAMTPHATGGVCVNFMPEDGRSAASRGRRRREPVAPRFVVPESAAVRRPQSPDPSINRPTEFIGPPSIRPRSPRRPD